MKRRIMTIVETLLFILLILSIAAADSKCIVLPAIVMLVSALGLLVMSRLEGYR